MDSQLRKFSIPFALLAVALVWGNASFADDFGGGVNTFTVEFVTIGDPGNPADTTGQPSPGGSVGYVYRMSKFEISEDMIDKANAEGGLGLTHAGWGSKKPATGIGWIEAAIFVNWLNTSTGHSPAYKIVGGDHQPWDPTDSGYDPFNHYRNTQALYFLPSADEWYKAAYYDPVDDSYHLYATGTDVAPTPVAAGIDPGTAVWNQMYVFGPADIDQAGGLSPFGTMGQSGNVMEWEETEYDLVNDGNSDERGVRGGHYNEFDSTAALHMSAYYRRFDLTGPAREFDTLGFRVARLDGEPRYFDDGFESGDTSRWSQTVPDRDRTPDTFGSGENSFDIFFTTIGDVGILADTTGDPNPAGSVDYVYRMSKFEISEGMIDKANAEGGLGLTHTGWGRNKPATGIGWIEAAIFVNWLNTSTGHSPAYKIVGGDHQPWDPADPGYDPTNPFRNTQAKYFLPSADEWYKAAFYDPVWGGYRNYATGGDDLPTPVASGNDPGTAVWGQTIVFGPARADQAGGLSPYGTMGQSGNVMEWEETESDLVNDGSSIERGLRGGHYNEFFPDSGLHLSALWRGFDLTTPSREFDNVGFRVASY